MLKLGGEFSKRYFPRSPVTPVITTLIWLDYQMLVDFLEINVQKVTMKLFSRPNQYSNNKTYQSTVYYLIAGQENHIDKLINPNERKEAK